MELLELREVKKYFGELRAVDDINLQIEEGGITAVIGPNGAGKSTLFNLITGLYPVTSGRIIFKGKDITNSPPYQIVRRGIGRSFQITNIFPGLTVMENTIIAAIPWKGGSTNFFRDIETREELDEEASKALSAVGILDKKKLTASTLSHGDQKRLEIALSLLSQPELLLLDEPTAGMNVEEAKNTVELIKNVANQRNVTVLFTEHDISIVFSISDRIVVLHQGQIIADGAPEVVRKNQRVKEAYLGKAQDDGHVRR